ncbi:MAG: Na(+)/H(+) antiporter subunit C [Actinomyces urogenitalis]|jgi:multicomponent Na+:H+ antiporter subunit C|uniref:Na+/H+ antiporter subunit C n=3 Tax=Actinomyces urogenitalis TaxID=103621 RepID=A0A2I1KRI4_9ACTO|nr:Na(+)/H(+) antiporter subunit C [Actinomyces urogenitalis]ETJ06771.1 MAG: Monovalent cation/H+ antiporter subunit C [Actinomyces urogenitalis DORA_12]EEH64765.1 putative monovalent cation/H+ antiporter subunit C [Actinomyces urogenitalis DSM 15434]KGF02825.1 NADH-ubiquinone oxidoreductase subunit 4L [Actinomyces urogenitalis S6-C4]MBS5977324.1 Na(+)/H(+) antiporter subunit C [Actinomyces urogenitalis]MBS6072776.1 Na(+)/H(+) antiporter subunit C [Actinomyces urogenitalis]
MTANLTLALVAGLLVACGVYLLTERSLSRILMGVILMSNGVNVLFLVAAGRAGRPAILGQEDPSAMTDPLPQAMVLTAIVITMAVSAFVMTMAYRSFQLSGHDEVRDDVEDRRIRELAQRDETSTSFEEQTFSDTGEDVVSE